MKMTDRQLKILQVLHNRNPDGTEVDLDQLLSKLHEDPDCGITKASLQFSIRSLIRYECMERKEREKRRGKSRRILMITETGRQTLGAGGVNVKSIQKSSEPAFDPSRSVLIENQPVDGS